MSSIQAQLLRDVSELIREHAEQVESCCKGSILYQYWVADWFEREADELDDTPYTVDSDWIERNYLTPLGAARAFLDCHNEHASVIPAPRACAYEPTQETIDDLAHESHERYHAEALQREQLRQLYEGRWT